MDRIEHFMGYVEQSDNGCWNWTGYRIAAGYGKATILGTRRKQLAHRLAYELFVGPIPAGLTIDHLCGNTSCVNPGHLEPCTLRENIRRANPERSVCGYGHTLADAYIDTTPAGYPYKKCRTCHLARVRRRRERLARTHAAAEGAR